MKKLAKENNIRNISKLKKEELIEVLQSISKSTTNVIDEDYFELQETITEDDFDEPLFTIPNAVTKVRIYIYIEGQDIDNYDFASLGKKISVAFGFTKERFYGEDINYDGSDITATLPDDVIRANHWKEITTKSDN